MIDYSIESFGIDKTPPKKIMGMTPTTYYLLLTIVVFAGLSALIVYLQKTQTI